MAEAEIYEFLRQQALNGNKNFLSVNQIYILMGRKYSIGLIYVKCDKLHSFKLIERERTNDRLAFRHTQNKKRAI